MKPIEPIPPDAIPLEVIEQARRRIEKTIVRTPLVRLNIEEGPSEIYLKLENLQPIGSFKLRGAANAMAAIAPEMLTQGVYTASAGNMAQGVAYAARAMQVPCRVVVPDTAPRAKLDAIERLGGEVIKVTFDEWWTVMMEHGREGIEGMFIHPFGQTAVIAGNGTIGLEILEDCPDVDAVIVPFGGGGLSSGIASALRASKPDVKVFASEVETAAPLKASLVAGEPRFIQHTPSFVDGIGGKSVFEEMWPLVKEVITDSITVSVGRIADAIRLLVERNRTIAEGAGASSVAAALTGRAGAGKIVCVVSGGNIDTSKLTTILRGKIPSS